MSYVLPGQRVVSTSGAQSGQSGCPTRKPWLKSATTAGPLRRELSYTVAVSASTIASATVAKAGGDAHGSFPRGRRARRRPLGRRYKRRPVLRGPSQRGVLRSTRRHQPPAAGRTFREEMLEHGFCDEGLPPRHERLPGRCGNARPPRRSWASASPGQRCCAMRSALTKLARGRTAARVRRTKVDLPAPLGPTTRSRRRQA